MKHFNKSLCCKAILLGCVLGLTACGGSSSDSSVDTTDTNTTTVTDTDTTTVTDTTTAIIDITDAIFTNTSSDCADYDNSYEADVTDVQEATDFVLDVVISSDDDF